MRDAGFTLRREYQLLPQVASCSVAVWGQRWCVYWTVWRWFLVCHKVFLWMQEVLSVVVCAPVTIYRTTDRIGLVVLHELPRHVALHECVATTRSRLCLTGLDSWHSAACIVPPFSPALARLMALLEWSCSGRLTSVPFTATDSPTTLRLHISCLEHTMQYKFRAATTAAQLCASVSALLSTRSADSSL